jgi:hypothetical protein
MIKVSAQTERVREPMLMLRSESWCRRLFGLSSFKGSVDIVFVITTSFPNFGLGKAYDFAKEGQEKGRYIEGNKGRGGGFLRLADS